MSPVGTAAPDTGFTNRMLGLLSERLASGARWELGRIFDAVLKKDFLQVFAGDALSEDEKERVTRAVERRLSGEPLGHIIGRSPFADFELEVDPDTFIPRPETELLVEEAVGFCGRYAPGAPVHAADLGCGSGNISIGLARRLPGAGVLAVEKSPAAARTASRNVAAFGLEKRIRVVVGDYLAGGLDDSGRYDIILANPPYVAAHEWDALDTEVRREPVFALVGGKNGDTIARAIIARMADHLNEGGALIMEVGLGQAGPLAAFAASLGAWGPARIAADAQGIERILVFEKLESGEAWKASR